MYFLTTIKAIDPQTLELSEWAGPKIIADSEDEAQEYCNTHGMGYCKVIGQLIETVDVDNELCLN